MRSWAQGMPEQKRSEKRVVVVAVKDMHVGGATRGTKEPRGVVGAANCMHVRSASKRPLRIESC